MKSANKLYLSLLFVVQLGLFPTLSHASIIFNFTITASDMTASYYAEGVSPNDSFSIGFNDSTHFASGITATDVSSISYNSAYLGTASYNSCSLCTPSDLASIFHFINLGGNNWQLNLDVGGSGASHVFQAAQGASFLSLGQGSYEGFVLENASYQIAQLPYSSLHTFSAVNASSVPEPATLTLLSLGLLGLGFSRKRKKS